MNTCNILVIGGGISGLATANWLSLAGIPVEVWESEGRLGGKIVSETRQGYLTEQAASLVMNFRPEVSEFLKLSKLENNRLALLSNKTKKRYMVRHGALLSVPLKPAGLFMSPIWSWRAKLKMLAEPLMPRGKPDEESVSSFIRRRLGDELLETAIEPFIGGTMASDPDQANAASTLPRLCALENQYGSIGAGIVVNKFLRRRTAMTQDSFSFEGGMSSMINGLAAAPDISCSTNHCVSEISKLSGQWRVTAQTPDGERTMLAKHIVLSLPAYQAAKLLKPLDQDLHQQLSGINYAPITLVHTGYDRGSVPHPLDGNGFLVPRSEKGAINGNLWPSSLFEGRAPKGKVLLTTYLGGAKNPNAAQLSDDQSLTLVCDELKRYLGITASPEMTLIHRHSHALPLYFGNYPQRCGAIAKALESHRGLHIESNYIGGVSVRDRLANSRLTARRIVAELGASEPQNSPGWDLLHWAPVT